MLKSILIISFVAIFVQLAFADSFEQECLNKHNEYRALHGADPLVLDDELQALAQGWADSLASTDSFAHNPDTAYGENIWAVWGADSIDGATPVTSWYDEIQYYDWNNPGFSNEVGHFTQVVWKESQRLGCAISSNGGSAKVVANYDPPGNYIGAFEENVQQN